MRKSTTIWSVAIASAVLLGASLLFVINSRVDAQAGTGGRLVTIHDRGQEKVLLSDAETVGDALKDAGVSIDGHDTVEPAIDQKLVASEYQINIYRARPVTVIDGAIRQKVVTPYQTAEQIVKDTGIVLYPEDTTKLSQSGDFVMSGAGLQLTIDRAAAFNLNLYGTVTTARTQSLTVGDMLKEKGISLGENDRVSVPLSSPLVAGSELQVWREGKQTITAEEPVQFEVKQINDANQDVGYKAIQTPGVIGKKNVTYEVEIRNGQEVGRIEIASIITAQSTIQVEIIGSKPKNMLYTGGGSKSEWLAQSVIPSNQWGYADFMVTKESGWNPNAVNKSSGACGLAQALPCSKVPGNPYNPIDSLNWMNGYVNGRYGGWEGAYTFWQKNRWY